MKWTLGQCQNSCREDMVQSQAIYCFLWRNLPPAYFSRDISACWPISQNPYLLLIMVSAFSLLLIPTTVILGKGEGSVVSHAAMQFFRPEYRLRLYFQGRGSRILEVTLTSSNSRQPLRSMRKSDTPSLHQYGRPRGTWQYRVEAQLWSLSNTACKTQKTWTVHKTK